VANPFRGTAVYYFQVPQFVMESSIWRGLKPASQSLYVFLCYRVQAEPRNAVTLSAEDMKQAGLSASSVNRARKELQEKRLVDSEPAGKDGHSYWILDPYMGQPLVQHVDFNELPAAALQDYFMHHLANYSPVLIDDGIKACCPFHSGDRVSRTDLTVKFSGGGWWRCAYKPCAKWGRLVAFERAIAETHGQPITATEAHHKVQRILTKAANKKAQEKADELAENRALLGIQRVCSWDSSEPL